MKKHLAQLNIARFRLPVEHPVNADFVNNLDRVNAIAEASDGFIWRLKGEGNDATDLQAFPDPEIITNMSLWRDVDALAAFVYRNPAHLEIMRRRKEWFERIEFHMVLWWVDEGHIPTIPEGIERLELLKQNGAAAEAFTFATAYTAEGQRLGVIRDRCA